MIVTRLALQFEAVILLPFEVLEVPLSERYSSTVV